MCVSVYGGAHLMHPVCVGMHILPLSLPLKCLGLVNLNAEKPIAFA